MALKKTLITVLAGISLLGVYSSAASDPNPAMQENPAIYIHAGSLLAVPGKPVRRQQTIIVKDDKITEIKNGFVFPPEGKVIDLADQFVLPGLIDSHVHLRMEYNPNIRLDAVTRRPEDVTLDALVNARKTLLAGFTSVQDVGGPDAIFALRDAINAGKVAGPRIRASGAAVSPTGGHGDTHGYRQDVLDVFHSPSLCDGPADCRRATRAVIKRGADVVKITATGGVLSNTAAGTAQQFFNDELRAITETAKKMGRKVTAHAHGKDGIDSALRNGVKSIEHGTYMDRESAALFKKHKAVLVPTVLAGMTVVDWANNTNWLPPASRKKALEVGPQMINMLRIAHENGVEIAFGTDSGVSKHGDNAQEFIHMRAAGMSASDAIIAATINAARHIEMEDKIGIIQPGMYADIIAVDGSPLANIEELLDVDFVMKGGKVYKD